MREIKYLSPSSLAKFYDNRIEFYTRYLCDVKSERRPQEGYMGVGSGFDAFVKHNIYRDIFGAEAVKNSEFDFDTIFTKQVEEHNRQESLMLASDIWGQYVESGAYDRLRSDIAASPYAPEMEFRISGTVGGVPMLGLPDLRYVTSDGVHVICDFKVNGSTSKTGSSPFVGYAMCLDTYNSRTHGKSHRKFSPMKVGSLTINATPLEQICDYWADQLSTYAWLLGEEVGSEQFVIRMEQICMRPVKARDLPRGKFATHLNRVSSGHQTWLLKRYQEAWDAIQSGHIFSDLTVEESRLKCSELDEAAKIPAGVFPALRRSQSAPRFYLRK